MLLRKFGCFLLVFIYAIAVNAQTADEVVSKYIQFTGGANNWKTVKTIVTSGIYNYGGIEFPFTAYSKAPNLYKFIVPFNGKYYAQAFDGSKGWKIDAFKNETGKTILTGKPARALANEADVELESPFIDYMKKGHEVMIEGIDSINSIPCYRVKLTRNDGREETCFFNTNNYQMVMKRAASRNAEMENTILDTYYSDYHTVKGITIPYKAISKSADQTILTITVTSVEVNTPVADSAFK